MSDYLPLTPMSDLSPQLIEAGYNRLFLEEYALAAERFDQALRCELEVGGERDWLGEE